MSFLRNLFARRGSPKAPRPEILHDPLLGDMHLDEEGERWAANHRGVELAVGEPDERLLEHLRTIVRDFDAFRETVAAFLATAAETQPRWSAEISQLTLSSVHLFKPPANGMLFFDGPDEYRVWRCDYIDGKPVHLGFDD